MTNEELQSHRVATPYLRAFGISRSRVPRGPTAAALNSNRKDSIMARNITCTIVSIVALYSGGLYAAPDKRGDPAMALKRAARSLQKAKSYRASFSFRAGLSNHANHRIDQLCIRTYYSANVFREIMQVEAPQAFLYRGKGAIVCSESQRWRTVLATAEGRRLERLFAHPLEVLRDAVAKPTEIEWATKSPSLIIRVKPDRKTMVRRLTEFQNSGCMSRGRGVSRFLARLDKSRLQAIYEFEIDPASGKPVRISMQILVGRKGEGRDGKGREFGDVEHVVFQAKYRLSQFDTIKAPKVPKAVRKIIR